MTPAELETIRERFRQGDYAISDHAIWEARKDGIEPETIRKLEWIAVHGKLLEEYPDRARILLYAELAEEKLPIHIVVEHACPEEPVIVTAYVPESQYWIKDQKRKERRQRST